MTRALFSPGSLVRARGREWIVLVGSDAENLRVRPLSGSEVLRGGRGRGPLFRPRPDSQGTHLS